MDYGLGGYGSINAFVESKLRRFSQRERSFRTMFDLMFSESENVMYERSEGYRIKKTTYGEAHGAKVYYDLELELWKKNYNEDSL